MIAFFDKAHMEGQWKRIERASRYPFHPVSIFAGFFILVFSNRLFSFCFWAPVGFYKGEEGATAITLSKNRIERGEVGGIIPFSPAGSRDDV